MKRILGGLAAAVTVLLIVVGGAWALVRWGRPELLGRIDWRHVLVRPDDGSLLLLGLTIIGWVAWLAVIASLVSELIALLSGGRLRPHIPGAGLFAPASAVLVAAIVGLIVTQLGSASSGMLSGAPGGAPVSAGVFKPVAASHYAGESGSSAVADSMAASGGADSSMAVTDAGPAPAHSRDTAGLAERQSAASNSEQSSQFYTVQPNDDLWTLATTHLGDGSRWRDICAANSTLILDPMAPLQPGTVLAMPDATAHALSALSGPAPAEDIGTPTSNNSANQVTVRPGDTLWGIAGDHLGDPLRWPDLAAANTEVNDPNLIYPGEVLQVPVAQPAAKSVGPAHDFVRSNQELAGPSGETDRSGIPSDAAPTPDRQADQVIRTQVGAPSQPAVENPAAASEPAASSPRTAQGDAHEPPSSVSSVAIPAATPVTTANSATDEDRAQDHAEEHAGPAAAESAVPDEASAPLRHILGPVGVSLASVVIGAVALRRQGQGFRRPVGKRSPRPTPGTQRFTAALRQRADQSGATPLPSDREPIVVDAGLALELTDGGQPLRLNLADGLVRLSATDSELVVGLLSSLAMQAATAGSDEEVYACGPQLGWLSSLEEPGLHVFVDPEAGLHRLRDDLARRLEAVRVALPHPGLTSVVTPGGESRSGSATVTSLRPAAGQWVRQLYVFESVPAGSLQEFESGDLVEAGMCVIAAATGPGADIELNEDALTYHGATGEPQLLLPPARRALEDLYHTANADDFETASWWHTEPCEGTVIPLRPSATVDLSDLSEETPMPAPPLPDTPYLMLLGPVEMVGARGEVPPRAVKQCLEYCAWILANPGRSAPAMVRDLLVAESTRRSNMSRLRAWLGDAPDGQPYLPDAYSGRIALHTAVTSDWEQLRLLMSGGVNRASSESLQLALRMVRGAPMADAAPGQWHWAEEMRIEMVELIRDMAVVLANRALDVSDLATARWAVARALTAAPEDEQLMGLRIRTEHAAGNRAEVERLVLHVTRQARLLGVDLSEDFVIMLQEVMEGQARARFA